MRKSVLIFVVLTSVTACATPSGSRGERNPYDTSTERMAEDYRMGRYENVHFEAMTPYFRSRVGHLTVPELRNLLGEPRVVTTDDGYYRYALNIFYGLDVVSDPSWNGGDKHDLVLHYGEYGPPEHHVPDASLNLFFIVKDDLVVGVQTLFP